MHSFTRQAELLGGDKPSIHLGWAGGAPAVIFSPILAMLQHHLDHLEQVLVCRWDMECAAQHIQCHTMKLFHSKNIGFGTIFLHYHYFLRANKNHDSKIFNILGIQHKNQMRGQKADYTRRRTCQSEMKIA